MIDSELLGLPSLRAAAARHDITALYRILKEHGVLQRTIAAATGQSQSEVSEVLSGRQVQSYDVLVRISERLGIPRAMMGLAYADDSQPGSEGEPEPVGEVSEEMKRRALLAVGSVSLLGVPALGELLHIPAAPATPTSLPSRLGASDVAAIRSLTEELRTVARTYGGCAETISSVAQRSLPLMSIPAADQTRSALSSALAELHTLAGWTCVDSGLHDHARAHFAKVMDLAAVGGDGVGVASALRHAGVHMADAHAWNDSLKSFQLGLIKLTESPGEAEALAWLHGETALPLAAMGYREEALAAIERARSHELADPFDAADMDGLTSSVYLHLGALDTAERFARSAVRRRGDEGHAHRDSVEAGIALAALHARAGESDAIPLAHRAISSVATLLSTRARVKLSHLAAALETRSRPDFAELARRARSPQRECDSTGEK